MKRFIEGEHRTQSTLFPERLDEYIAQDNAIRVIDVFVDKLDLQELGFTGGDAEDLCVWIFKPDPVESTPGARKSSQR